MFFIGIFGMGTKDVDIRTINNMICKSCGRMTSYKLVKTYNYFQLFFIPIFRWGEKYYLISKCCGSLFELSRQDGEDLANGNNSILSNLNINIVEDNSQCGKLVCHRCGKEVDESFEFCPYCGTKLK
ncbi:MAG: zinc ribbon domain-containing protein [Clostridium sp.]|uniref:zinc ribbon domain-containing protein n=1 Tax=Clostridium sp. TaxID=1506 RepID=UPI0039EA0470